MYSVGLTVLIFVTVCLMMLSVILILSWLIRPLRRRPAAEETYECGMPAKGDARAIGFLYINYAALFLVFDVAALLVFLFATIDQPSPTIFICLLLGLVTLSILVIYGTHKRRYHAA